MKVQITRGDIYKMVNECVSRILKEEDDAKYRMAEKYAQRLKDQGMEKEEIDNILFSNFNLTLDKIEEYKAAKADEEERAQAAADGNPMPTMGDIATDWLQRNGYDKNGKELGSEDSEEETFNDDMISFPEEMHDTLTDLGLDKFDFDSKEEAISALRELFTYYRRGEGASDPRAAEKIATIQKLNRYVSSF